MQKEHTLFHATTRQGLEGAKIYENVYGCIRTRSVVPKGNLGGNLTPEKEAAEQYIRAYRGSGQWSISQGPPELHVMEFHIPGEFVRDVGVTNVIGCSECATTILVDARDLPDEYFDNVNPHDSGRPRSREHAVQLQQEGLVEYFAVPMEFFVGSEPIVYEWRGTLYPQEQ